MMRANDPTALTAAILTAICVALATCSRIPAPDPGPLQPAAFAR